MKIVRCITGEITVPVGQEPKLPSRTEIILENGARAAWKVAWDAVDPALYGSKGSFTVAGALVSEAYPNPLILNRADPYVVKHTDGFYYFTGSVPEYDRIVLRRAGTIAGLRTAEEAVIWTKHESGEMGNHIWAPELHCIDGVWYIYFAAGTAEDKWAIRQYALECAGEDPLQGPWTEKGKVAMNFESFTLDATAFEHCGTRYLVWAQYEGNSSNLYIAPMSSPWTISGNQVLLSSPEYDWERQQYHVNEGPAVLKRNGRIFLAYSASATDERYCMGMLTAWEDSNLLDSASWTKSPEPVFVSHEASSEYGPGHNSFTVTEDGAGDVLVYHARPYKGLQGGALTDPNRHARVQRLFWNPDGTPNLLQPGYVLDLAAAKPSVTVRVV